MSKAVDWYDDHAERMSALYETAGFDSVHDWLVGSLPPPPATVLDVGAGSGRDASWLAARGYRVVAAEPSASMRALARRLHPGASIRWIDDRLPTLAAVSRIGLSFDLVLLSAVWMHIPERDRSHSLRKMIALLKPGGILAMSFREGPAREEADIHRVTLDEVKTLVREDGARPEIRFEASLSMEREGLRWNQVAIGLPDRGILRPRLIAV